MTKTEQRYRELKQAFDKRRLKIDAYRHLLKKDIDPTSEEWDRAYSELEELEKEHEQALYEYCFARLEYEKMRG